MHEPCKEAQVSFACLFLDLETEDGENGGVGKDITFVGGCGGDPTYSTPSGMKRSQSGKGTVLDATFLTRIREPLNNRRHAGG